MPMFGEKIVLCICGMLLLADAERILSSGTWYRFLPVLPMERRNMQ